MPKYMTTNGAAAECIDPNRSVWYGQCGYWTDDWDAVVLVGPRIPACPKCKVPGFIGTAREWESGAVAFASTADNAGYVEFLNANKAKCFKGTAGGFLGAFRREKGERDLTKMKILPDGFKADPEPGDGGSEADSYKNLPPRGNA